MSGRMGGRGLDHIVHAVRDLDAAAALYRRLGFTVGARNRHPWGTHNHIVQLPGFFLELLTLAEPDNLGDDGFSALFGAFNRDFLAHGEGLSLLLLESRDAAADALAFRAARIARSDVMRFEREGKKPDGSTVNVAFSLVFARDPQAPAVGFAVCQQHYPDNFWNAAFQTHANGVARIAGVILLADDPSAHADFLRNYCGQPVVIGDGRVSATTPRGEIIIVQPARYRDKFKLDTKNVSRGTRFAAIRFVVRDVAAVGDMLKANGIAVGHDDGRVAVPADAALGAAFIFEPSGR